MKTALSAIAIVAVLGFAPAYAAGGPTVTTEIQAELKRLQQSVGAGEMSSKEYNIRKKELMADLKAQQAADAKK